MLINIIIMENFEKWKTLEIINTNLYLFLKNICVEYTFETTVYKKTAQRDI